MHVQMVGLSPDARLLLPSDEDYADRAAPTGGVIVESGVRARLA